MRSVLNWLAQPRENPWRRELHAPELFWTVAGPADDLASASSSALQEGNSDLAHAAAPLLNKLPKYIVWEHVDYVTVLLKTASRLSEDLFRRTAGNLHAAVVSGFRSGTPGQPYQKTSTSANAPNASVPACHEVLPSTFYKALVESAQHNVDRAIADDLSDANRSITQPYIRNVGIIIRGILARDPLAIQAKSERPEGAVPNAVTVTASTARGG